jgi:hypothetical protein
MNIEEIQQAIAQLSPDELARLREWLRGYENTDHAGGVGEAPPVREVLKKYRGAYKGKGLLRALMEERRRESLL